jgi:hypothetical protein
MPITSFVSDGSTLTLKQLAEKEDIDLSKNGYPIGVELSKEMQNKLNIVNGVSLPTMSDEWGNEIQETIKNVYSKYPELDGIVTKIDEKTFTGKDKDAFAQMTVGNGELSFNNRYFIMTVENLEEMWQKNLEANYHPQGTTWHAIVEHEIGHAVEGFISKIERANTGRDYHWDLGDVINPIFEKFGVDPFDHQGRKSSVQMFVEKNVSVYALTNIGKGVGKGGYRELFAETFAEYMNRGDNARPFAKAVGEAIEPYLTGKIKY